MLNRRIYPSNDIMSKRSLGWWLDLSRNPDAAQPARCRASPDPSALPALTIAQARCSVYGYRFVFVGSAVRTGQLSAGSGLADDKGRAEPRGDGGRVGGALSA